MKIIVFFEYLGIILYIYYMTTNFNTYILDAKDAEDAKDIDPAQDAARDQYYARRKEQEISDIAQVFYTKMEQNFTKYGLERTNIINERGVQTARDNVARFTAHHIRNHPRITPQSFIDGTPERLSNDRVVNAEKELAAIIKAKDQFDEAHIEFVDAGGSKRKSRKSRRSRKSRK
jgi:hypothetical protein